MHPVEHEGTPTLDKIQNGFDSLKMNGHGHANGIHANGHCKTASHIVAKKIELADDELAIMFCKMPDDSQVKHSKLDCPERETLTFPYIWLRDHCRCPSCYNPVTQQRELDFYQIAENIQPIEANLLEDGTEFAVTWPDGHKSTYHSDWLLQHGPKPNRRRFGNAYGGSKPGEELWLADRFSQESEMPIISAEEAKTPEGMAKHFENMIRFGFAIISGVEATHEATQRVSESVCLPQETVFGRFWRFSADAMDHADTAYGNEELKGHTDSTYYAYTTGIQVLSCLEHTGGTGGETLLIDGFSCLERLKRDDSKSFQFLATTPIPHDYLETGVHLYAEEPVIGLDVQTGRIKQIRYNYYDRAPFSNLPAEKVKAFYRSYRALTKIIREPANELWIKLLPGMVLFVDNWRVLHGRKQFSGKRIMSGCYLSRDDFTNRARVLGVLD